MRIILIGLAILLSAGCASKAEKAQDCAQNFLNAFLSNDLNAAASFCEEDLNKDLKRATDDFDKLDDDVKSLLKEQCSQLHAEIVSVERVNESDTFLVNYNIVRACPDNDGAEGNNEMINSSLKVVGGKVAFLNR